MIHEIHSIVVLLMMLFLMQAERSQVMTQLRTLGGEKKQFNSIMDEKRKEMEPLQQALGKLRGGSGGGRDRGMSICSSEAELNDVVRFWTHHICIFCCL